MKKALVLLVVAVMVLVAATDGYCAIKYISGYGTIKANSNTS